MDTYQKNKGRKAALTLEETKVKPKEYLEQGIQVSVAFRKPEILREESKLMEVICDRENLNKAYKTVLKNKGSAGIDGMTIKELLPYLKEHGQRIKEQLLDGRFKFQPVRQVEIPTTS